MGGPIRVTGPLLDILELLVKAWQDDQDLHGWAIMKATKRSGPTAYGVLDRLEDAGWVAGSWEHQHPEPGRPRRRFYRLTPTGAAAARDLLAERRPLRETGLRRQRPGFARTAWLVLAGLGGARWALARWYWLLFWALLSTRFAMSHRGWPAGLLVGRLGSATWTPLARTFVPRNWRL